MSKFTFFILTAVCFLIFSAQAYALQEQTCFACHEKAQFTNKVVHQPVEKGECVTCHNPHVAKYEGLLRYEGGKLCVTCHTDVFESFKTGIVHEPINRYQCNVCHSPHSAPEKGLVSKNIKRDCIRCHSALPEEFTYMHEPYGSGECGACHRSHNSEWPMLLITSKDKLCAECHDQDDLLSKHKGFPGTLQRCLTCHSPHGSNRKALIRNFLHKPLTKGCTSCHVDGAGQVGIEKCIECHPAVLDQMQSVHSHLAQKDGNSCVNCHTPHAGDEERLLLVREKQVCAQCHRPSIDKYKNSPYKHESIDNCSDCHFPHGGNDMAMLKGNGLEVCAICHEDQGSFTHPVGPEVPDPRTGRMMTCITCHNPMGTNYPDNLIMDGKEKLCVQCHDKY